MNQLVDLRKKPTASVQSIQPQPVVARPDPKPTRIPTQVQKPSGPIPAVTSGPTNKISWIAASQNKRVGTRTLQSIVVVSIVGGGVLWFLQQSILIIVFFVFAIGVALLHHRRKVQAIPISITLASITIGKKIYFHREFRSFWIEYASGGIRELSLQTKAWYMPYIKIPLHNQNPVAVRSLMMQVLPEQEHEISLVDAFLKR